MSVLGTASSLGYCLIALILGIVYGKKPYPCKGALLPPAAYHALLCAVLLLNHCRCRCTGAVLAAPNPPTYPPPPPCLLQLAQGREQSAENP